jgi:hypothetical protein
VELILVSPPEKEKEKGKEKEEGNVTDTIV